MKIFGTHDDATIAQLKRCVDAEEGSIGILCADGHLGYSMPIGGVVGYQRYISPSGVGYDIACGNLAVKTLLKAADVPQVEMERIADEITRRVSFGVGRVNNEPIDDPVFCEIKASPVEAQRKMIQLAVNQLGTVGSGNHYVDVLEDTEGYLWVAVHFGSRGFGWKTAKGFMNIAQGKLFDDKGGEGDMNSPPLLLSAKSEAGQDYIEAMKIAGQYAYAGRTAVVQKVLQIMGTSESFIVHNHHNFAWFEHHKWNMYWVVRKGATPAQPGQWGFVGGSMGDISVVIRGKDSPTSKEALYSTIHGAGRVMSRTQAAGKQKWHKAFWSCGNYRVCDFKAPIRDFEAGPHREHPRCLKCGSKLHRNQSRMERLGGGVVDFETEKAKLVGKGIILRGAGADEAPPVYRPLESVLEAHKDTIEVVHTLTPRIVVMAGANEFDPYKD